MLLGGPTYALWDAQSNVSSGTITNGNFDVLASELSWFDFSTDRADATIPVGLNGHPIDLATWRAVPADSVIATSEVTGVLEGENMLANLSVTVAGKPVTELMSETDPPGSGTDPSAVSVTPSGLRLSVLVYDVEAENFVDNPLGRRPTSSSHPRTTR